MSYQPYRHCPKTFLLTFPTLALAAAAMVEFALVPPPFPLPLFDSSRLFNAQVQNAVGTDGRPLTSAGARQRHRLRNKKKGKNGKLINIMSQGDFVSYTWPNLFYQVKELAKEGYPRVNQLVIIILGLRSV